MRHHAMNIQDGLNYEKNDYYFQTAQMRFPHFSQISKIFNYLLKKKILWHSGTCL